jgi:tripartite-type tricarboxylate transporter receptor subunit TctC
MLLPRRGLIAASIGLAAPALAQDAYPTRPVNVVVPWGPGGPTDAFARVLSQRLSTDLGQPFPVDNRVGANGTIGMAFAARARPDGHTVVIAPNSTYAVAPHLYQLPYHNERDFTGVGLLVSMPIFMLVHRSSHATTVAEYVAMARRPNARLTYANASVGATSHLATEMLLQSAGIEVLEVGYRGGGPAVQAVVAGEAGMVFMPAAAVMGFINSGELRALGVASATRSALAPNVPTFREQGLPDVEIVEHVAMLAPAGTPQPILERLNAASRAALRAPDMQPRLDALAVTAETRPLSEWAEYAVAESARWGAVVRARNIRIQ